MKKLLLTIPILFAFTSVKAQDLPPNPKPGQCYIRCKTPNNDSSEWKAINCKTLEELRNDYLPNNVDAIQNKLINLGYKLKTTGIMDSETIDAYLDFKNGGKKLKRKLRKESRRKQEK